MKKEIFNLCEIFDMDAMHDQRIARIDLTSGTLSFYFEDLHFRTPHSPEAKLYFDTHKMYHACILMFSTLEEADLFVEIRKKTQQGVKVTEYYDDEWIRFLQANHFSVEVYNFYYGYRSVLICGSLVTQTGQYSDDCVIRVTADRAVYQWQSTEIKNDQQNVSPF